MSEEQVEKKVKREERNDDNKSISDLSDNILLHIMSFMDTESAVQTCVLSKQWKNLCKCLTSLSFSNRWPQNFDDFVNWILLSRDNTYSLLKLVIENHMHPFKGESIERVIKYALLHNVEHLKVDLLSRIRFMANSDELLSQIFCCQTLKSLELNIRVDDKSFMRIPLESFNMSVLKTLHISYLMFTVASFKECADPFSKCHVLNTLVLRHCSLNDHKKVLRISNATLSSLTIFEGEAHQIELSTPNVSFVTFKGCVNHQLFSKCNLSFLREVNIFIYGDDTSWDGKSSIIIGWLQVLANVKILTFSLRAFRVILRDISNPSSMKPQPPCFGKLECLKVKKQLFTDISDEEVYTVVKYLLQNSPTSANVDIRKNA